MKIDGFTANLKGHGEERWAKNYLTKGCKRRSHLLHTWPFKVLLNKKHFLVLSKLLFSHA